ncbi:trypsin-like peptidase domain-containing protein [Streptomyces sp. NPDC005408]|uniref:trypsin-like peptidase domain-containing protein n=1 Tax=Streptomyces sp. NPDC005408 TaxID=3155341 RepID=UPI0033AA4C9D
MGRGDLATLVRICDLAGRPRGTGFVADEQGTVVTSHEAVDGLVRVVLHAPGDRTCLAEADAITPLPEAGLALVRTEGLGVRPLPISPREQVGAGTYVRLAARGWREARVLGAAQVTYTATDRFHLVGDALELAIGTDGSDALRLGGEAAGGPVLDAETGAVLAVLGTALQSGRRAAGFALPLRAAGMPPDGPLAELLRRNAATVPAYGYDLNLAAVLELTATSVGPVGGPSAWPDPVERPDTVREFGAFTALVMGLVGDPGTGRTTELAALAARRARGAEPAPTVWLRGADLHADDGSVADALARTLRQAGRILAASGARGDMELVTPARVARLAREAGRPLLVLLDGPEEMPPVLAHRLSDWTAGTVSWLGAGGVRMVVGCRPEHWEQAGALYPQDVLHQPATPAHRLPPALRIGGLSAAEAERALERYGLPAGAIAAADERHPLALRLLAEVREALPGEVPGRPCRVEVLAAHLDLLCLRIAVRIAAASGPQLRGSAVRRLAAKVAGQVHEAARRCLGPGQGELDRESFEEIFPWHMGWASAVLTEGLLVPAGGGYRFAHEELADWVQAAHLDLDAALHSLVHRWHARAPVGLPSRPGASGRRTGYVPPPPGSGVREPRSLPVPRHRIGPVVQALLLTDRVHGHAGLAPRLAELVEALDGLEEARGESGEGSTRADDARWWGAHLLGEALLRVPDAGAYVPVLRLLAERITRRSVREGGPEHLGGLGEFGPWFWERLRVTEAQRLDLLRRLVPADGAPGGLTVAADGAPGGLTVAAAGGAPGSRTARVDAVPGDRTSPRADAVLGAVEVPGADGAPRADAVPGGDGAPRADGAPGGRTPRADAVLGADEVPGADGAPGGRTSRGDAVLGAAELPADGAPGGRTLSRADGAPRTDGAPGSGMARGDAVAVGPTGPRYLDAVVARLTAAPSAVQPLLCRWFTDETPLPADPGAEVRPTVAAAAQALLYVRRDLAIDDLTEALVATAHPRADELLAALAEEEPSALCRAVDRWAHDPRPERRVAAASYGLATVPRVTTDADRELLRYAAIALLARPADTTLHGPALALLVRDPCSRSRYLARALTAFAAGDPRLPASALAAALTTHLEPVLAALQTRLNQPGDGAGEVLNALAGVTTPALARRAASLVGEYIDHRPEGAAHAAAYVDRRLEQGPAARALLFPLVTALLRGRPVQVRGALAAVLAAPGSRASRPLRAELLDVLLEYEQYETRDLAVLDAVLRAAALGCATRTESRTRELVHRTGLLLVRTPEGATCFDRRLVELAREVPGFAALVAGWLARAPQEWATVVGPSARRTVESMGSPVPMRTDSRGHGSLRPA